MTGLFRLSGSLLLAGILLFAGFAPAFAGSTVIDGPGFKVEKRNGWFGRKSTVYQDAMGNTIERRTGLFGRESSRTKVFGSEATKHGNNVTVNGPNGTPLVTRKKTLLGGEQTHIDGNGIFQSVKDLLQNP